MTAATLLDVLVAHGFRDAATASDAPELDRRLVDNNWVWAVEGDEFVAACYFADESNGMELGPLHVSLFGRGAAHWLNLPDAYDAAKRAGIDCSGPAIRIQVTPKFVRLETHMTPSAGFQLLLDHALNVVGGFCGFGVQSLRDGSMLFTECMVHFAPQHQEALRFFDASERRSSTVFAADDKWSVEREYRVALRRVFSQLPESTRQESGAYFDAAPKYDVTIDPVKIRADEERIAMFVKYGSDFLAGVLERAGNHDTPPVAESIVDCERASGGWLCEQHELSALAESVGIRLDGAATLSTAARDALILAPLEHSRAPR